MCKANTWCMADGIIILWHMDLLLGSDQEVCSYTTAVTRQWPINSNRRTVFSVQSMLYAGHVSYWLVSWSENC